MVLRSLLDLDFDGFLCFWNHFCEHRFCCIHFHPFGAGFGIFFDVFVDIFSVRARNLLDLQKQLFLLWIRMSLQFRKTWFLMFFMILAGHRLLDHFGIPFVSNSMFVGDMFKVNFGDRNFVGFGSKWSLKMLYLSHPFWSLFTTFVTTLVPFP